VACPAKIERNVKMRTKPLKNKKKKYWGGFCDGFLCGTQEKYGDENVLAIYFSKRKAKENYQDVRPVEIRELRTK